MLAEVWERPPRRDGKYAGRRWQSHPQIPERRPSELWVTIWQGLSFIKLKEAGFVGK